MHLEGVVAEKVEVLHLAGHSEPSATGILRIHDALTMRHRRRDWG